MMSGRSDHVIDTPMPMDVLLGRGKSNITNPGNIRFQELVKLNQSKYDDSNNKVKRMIITGIMNNVLSTGQFLQRGKTGLWVVVHKDACQQKIAHALQYRIRQRDRYDSNKATSPSSVEMQHNQQHELLAKYANAATVPQHGPFVLYDNRLGQQRLLTGTLESRHQCTWKVVPEVSRNTSDIQSTKWMPRLQYQGTPEYNAHDEFSSNNRNREQPALPRLQQLRGDSSYGITLSTDMVPVPAIGVDLITSGDSDRRFQPYSACTEQSYKSNLAHFMKHKTNSATSQFKHRKTIAQSTYPVRSLYDKEREASVAGTTNGRPEDKTNMNDDRKKPSIDKNISDGCIFVDSNPLDISGISVLNEFAFVLDNERQEREDDDVSTILSNTKVRIKGGGDNNSTNRTTLESSSQSSFLKMLSDVCQEADTNMVPSCKKQRKTKTTTTITSNLTQLQQQQQRMPSPTAALVRNTSDFSDFTHFSDISNASPPVKTAIV